MWNLLQSGKTRVTAITAIRVFGGYGGSPAKTTNRQPPYIYIWRWRWLAAVRRRLGLTAIKNNYGGSCGGFCHA